MREMTYEDGFKFGAGLALAFVAIRSPFVIISFGLGLWRDHLIEKQGTSRQRLSALKRHQAFLEGLIGRDPEAPR